MLLELGGLFVLGGEAEVGLLALRPLAAGGRFGLKGEVFEVLEFQVGEFDARVLPRQDLDHFVHVQVELGLCEFLSGEQLQDVLGGGLGLEFLRALLAHFLLALAVLPLRSLFLLFLLGFDLGGFFLGLGILFLFQTVLYPAVYDRVLPGLDGLFVPCEDLLGESGLEMPLLVAASLSLDAFEVGLEFLYVLEVGGLFLFEIALGLLAALPAAEFVRQVLVLLLEVDEIVVAPGALGGDDGVDPGGGLLDIVEILLLDEAGEAGVLFSP